MDVWRPSIVSASECEREAGDVFEAAYYEDATEVTKDAKRAGYGMG